MLASLTTSCSGGRLSFVLASPCRNAHQHVHTGHYENNKKQSTPLTCSVSREEEKNSTAVFALLNALQTSRHALQPYASYKNPRRIK